MFEAVQQIIGFGKARETENVDARMGMRKRLLDRDKRHEHGHAPEGKAFYDYEQNTIAVQSALLFLEGFLEIRLDRVFPESPSSPSSHASWFKMEIGNQSNSFATRAYKHAAELSEKLRSSEPSADIRKAEDLKSIYRLIQDLRTLVDQGVEHISIESGSGFLEAIVESVAKIKSMKSS